MVLSRDEVVTIYTSKFKLLTILLLSLGFVVLGVWMLYMSRFETAITLFLLRIIGLASIVFFGLCGLYPAIKLFDTQPRLVLDSVGIIDRSSAVSVGRIPWQDIRKIDITQVERQKFLTFYVIEPQRYVQRGNFLQRQMNALNYKLYGSPIQISSASLKISFGELNNLVLEYHHRYASNNFS